jgi:dynein heavy chain
MGQGQEYHARKMMTESMAGGELSYGDVCMFHSQLLLFAGGWVLLQNVHLSLNFCAEIIDILIETEHVQDSFRLWVTTEVHTEFPIVRNSLLI